MLTIRNAQMEAFAVAANPGLHGDLANWVLERFPDFKGRDRCVVDDVVAEAIGQAQALAITERDAIAYFLGCRVLLGSGFHKYPPVLAVLSDTRIPPNSRPASLALDMTASDLRAATAWCSQGGRHAIE